MRISSSNCVSEIIVAKYYRLMPFPKQRSIVRFERWIMVITSGVRKKFLRGAKVLSQINLGECQRQDHSRVVREHAPGKLHLKIRIFVHSESKF